MKMNSQIEIHQTYELIRNIFSEARKYISCAVNFSMVQAYWNIGKIIVEEEQHGKKHADYGKALIKELSIRLTKEFSKGFSEQSLRNMRQFYYCFSIRSAARSKLLNNYFLLNTNFICQPRKSWSQNLKVSEDF